MTEQTTAETLGFQTQARKLLHLMINSLYSNREIFLRELISNASDAIDRLRFESLKDESLIADDPDFRIVVEVDEDAGTVAVVDNGIGMTRDEAVEQLGTIAKSGTEEFLGHLTGDEQKDTALIGQFGVGFYSFVHRRPGGRGAYAAGRGRYRHPVGVHRGGRVHRR